MYSILILIYNTYEIYLNYMYNYRQHTAAQHCATYIQIASDTALTLDMNKIGKREQTNSNNANNCNRLHIQLDDSSTRIVKRIALIHLFKNLHKQGL